MHQRRSLSCAPVVYIGTTRLRRFTPAGFFFQSVLFSQPLSRAGPGEGLPRVPSNSVLPTGDRSVMAEAASLQIQFARQILKNVHQLAQALSVVRVRNPIGKTAAMLDFTLNFYENFKTTAHYTGDLSPGDDSHSLM
jgi:hypothetical protein